MAQDILVEMRGLGMGRLRTRYKRFFADIELNAFSEGISGEIITAHVPNPGKMLGLLVPGTPALLTHVGDSRRKLQYRLEALRDGDVWVGVNTQWPNRVVAAAIAAGLIPSLSGYAQVRSEVKYGTASRVDFLATGHAALPDAWIEVKNVHFSRTPELAEFPDCVTQRGAKHLFELSEMVRQGHRAVVVFCVQRHDCTHFDIARDCDPAFGHAYDAAREAGVEFVALAFEFSERGLRYHGELEVL